MKKFLLKVKNDLFVYSFIFTALFLLICFILYLFNIRFRLWFIILMIIVLIFSFVIGVIQIALRESKIVKIIIIVLTGFLILFCLFFYKIFLFVFAFLYTPEHVTKLDGKKYVVVVKSFLNVDVSYYDYYGPFLMGTKEKVHGDFGNGGYDPFELPENVSNVIYTYYDKNGKKIYEKNVTYSSGKVVDEADYDNYEVKAPSIDDNVLYEVKFGKSIIRIRRTDSVMPQNMAVSVYKSTDGGKNFDCVSDAIIVSQEASFIFLDEKLGFIISSGNIWLNKNSKDFYVTDDGGKTFKTANFNYTNDKVEYMSIVGYPYFKDDVLHLTCEIYLSKEKIKKLDFISKDNGLTWSLS